jgi:3-hydroxyisobutyrate dehydrogenase
MASEDKRLRIGFVGLGEIGTPMARRIVGAGWPLTVFARRPQALQALSDTPALIAASLQELGQRSDVVAICVYDDQQVLDVALGDGILCGLRRGAIIVVHSTVRRETCQRLAEAAAPLGVEVLDAPVSGGPDRASAGTLSVMVGGKQEVFDRCKPVLESIAGMLRLIGPLGSGQAAKTINNALYSAQGRLVDEAIAFGEKLGLDRRALIEMLQAGSSDSFVLRRYAVTASLDYWVNQRGTAAGNVVNVLDKDVALYRGLAESAGRTPGDVPRLAQDFVDSLRALAGNK